MARAAGQLPVRAGSATVTCIGAIVGVAVDADHPVDLRRDLSFELHDGVGELVELALERTRRSRRCRWRRAPRRAARSGRRPPRCRSAPPGSGAAGRRSRSGIATAPARAAPAPRSAGCRGRRSGSGFRASRAFGGVRAPPRARRAGGAARRSAGSGAPPAPARAGSPASRCRGRLSSDATLPVGRPFRSTAGFRAGPAAGRARPRTSVRFACRRRECLAAGRASPTSPATAARSARRSGR